MIPYLYVSGIMTSAKDTKSLHLLCLVEPLPFEVQKLIPLKIKEIQKYEHPLLLETIETMHDTDEQFTKLDSIFSCLLAYLCVDQLEKEYNKELQDKVNEIVDHVLEKEPDNLVALCIKQKVQKAKTIRRRIKRLAHCKISLSHSYAVVAFYLYKLNIVEASIALFQHAIETWEENNKGNELKVVLWKYLLATSYRQQLNRSKFSKEPDIDPNATMKQVKDLLASGINLGETQPVLAARCYTDLALSYCIYKQTGKQSVSVTPSVEECYIRARKLCGEDTHVMEKYGMFLRRKSESQDSTEIRLQAAKVFEDLLLICPHRHVAAHQLGLLYKALWISEEGFSYSDISERKMLPKAKCICTNNNTETTSLHDLGRDHDLQVEAKEAKSESQNVGPSVASAKTPTVHGPSKHDEEVTDELQAVSSHYDHADNPSPKKSGYLKSAIKYFEMANTVSKGCRLRYLVDLARAYVSNGDDAAALGYFNNAKRALSSSLGRHSDTAYLYEQWAMFLSKQFDEGSETEDATTTEMSESESDCSKEKLNTIERYFLRSIRSGTHNKSKSKMAYHKLAEMLLKDTSGRKWPVLYEVYKLDGKDQMAKDLLKDKDMTQPKVRKLLKKQCIEDHDYDKYLNLAHTIYTKTADECLKQDIVEMTLLKMKHLPKQHDEDDETKPMKVYADYGDAIKVCLKRSTSLESEAVTCKANRREMVSDEKLDEAACDSNPPATEMIKDEPCLGTVQPKEMTHTARNPRERNPSQQSTICTEGQVSDESGAGEVQPVGTLQKDQVPDDEPGSQEDEQANASLCEDQLRHMAEGEQTSDAACGGKDQTQDRTSGNRKFDEAPKDQSRKKRQRYDADSNIFMACNDMSGLFCSIREILVHCGLSVKKYCAHSLEDDIPAGCNTETQIADILSQSQLMFLSDYSIHKDSSTRFEWIVTYAQDECQVPVCILRETDNPLPERWTTLPYLDIRNVGLQLDTQVHELMVNLFQILCDKDFSHCKNSS